MAGRERALCALRSGMSASAQLIGAVHAYGSGCGAAAAARQASRSQSPPSSLPAAHTRKGRVLHAAGHRGHTCCPAADEGTVIAGLYRAPSQGTCRRRFRLTGFTTVEPRRGRMPLLRADEIRAMRALRCARAHTYVHVGPSRRACAPACMRQCSFLRAAGQQHGVCRGDRSRKPRKLLVNRVRHVRAHPSGRTPHA